MKIIKNHCRNLDVNIQVIVFNLLSQFDKRINPKLIKSYVVKCNRGKAYLNENIITVPYWAFLIGEGYFKYYVAHELSHIISWRRYGSDNHDKYFYDVFKKLCPENIQFHELAYKKRSGISYGVKGDLNEAIKFKYDENYKK